PPGCRARRLKAESSQKRDRWRTFARSPATPRRSPASRSPSRLSRTISTRRRRWLSMRLMRSSFESFLGTRDAIAQSTFTTTNHKAHKGHKENAFGFFVLFVFFVVHSTGLQSSEPARPPRETDPPP